MFVDVTPTLNLYLEARLRPRVEPIGANFSCKNKVRMEVTTTYEQYRTPSGIKA